MNSHSPEDFAPVIPYLTVDDGSKALDFYQKAFDAETVLVMSMEDGTGGLHARFFVNGAMLMLREETPDIPAGAAVPRTVGRTPVTIRLRLENASAVDNYFAPAIAAGAETIQAPMNKSWGEQYARLRDPAGHVWVRGGPN